MSAAAISLIASSGPGAPPPSFDFSMVKLLMGFEGSNGATGTPGMDDESSQAHGTATVTNATISNTQHKFGSTSLSLPGSSNSHIIFADHNDWNFAAGNFTVEMFIYPTSVSGVQFLCGQWQNTGDLGWVIWLNGTTLSWNTSDDGFNNFSDIAGSGTVVVNSQQHVCIDYDGVKYRLYLEGVMIGSFGTARTLNDSSDNLAIGSTSNGASFNFNGYVDELRIMKGWAEYASDSGFTVPTGAFPRS